MMDLTTLKVGDEFASTSAYGAGYELHRVARFTKTQLVTEAGLRFNLNTNQTVGSERPRFVRALSDEMRRNLRRQRVVRRLHTIRLPDTMLEAAEQFLKDVDEALAG